MILRSMTATFGKLEGATLTLRPGLNVIAAPNEWGKSTWCAFLVAMLYGIDTRSRSTKTALAEKERYQPWSGSPMEGRIDLIWQGKNITLQRRTRGRIPLGDFSAFETDTGLPIAELNGENCGLKLLGVERSVFLRTGFIRLEELPVTPDEALRRRLNDLVTTGDESGAGDLLAARLRELKNRCRHNRTGLIPQVEAELAQCRQNQAEYSRLQDRQQELTRQLQTCEAELAALENHRLALGAAAVENARQRATEANAELRHWEQQCAGLPEEAEINAALQRGYSLQAELQELGLAAGAQAQSPHPPELPPFAGLTGEAALELAQSDQRTARQKGLSAGLILLLAVVTAIGILAASPENPWLLAFPLALTFLSAVLHRQRKSLLQKYNYESPERWVTLARDYGKARQDYDAAASRLDELRNRNARLRQRLQALTSDGNLQDYLDRWQAMADRRARLAQAKQAAAQASRALAELQPLTPFQPDSLTWNEADTLERLRRQKDRQRQLQFSLGQCQGRLESLENYDNQEAALTRRLSELQRTEAALELAQRTLEAAREELQRRFAPRISAQAQALFSRLTGGRYQALALDRELALSARAEGEATLRSPLWRSSGTADQLYLSLRLATAQALTPEAPLILDDALARFDPERQKNALDILSELPNQVILFTAHP